MFNTNDNKPTGVTIQQLIKSLNQEFIYPFHPFRAESIVQQQRSLALNKLLTVSCVGGSALGLIGVNMLDKEFDLAVRVTLCAFGLLFGGLGGLLGLPFIIGTVNWFISSKDEALKKKIIQKMPPPEEIGDQLLSSEDLIAYYPHINEKNWKAISHSQMLTLYQGLSEKKFEEILCAGVLSNSMLADWKILQKFKSFPAEKIGSSLRSGYFINRIREHSELLEVAIVLIPPDMRNALAVSEGISLCFSALRIPLPKENLEFLPLQVRKTLNEMKCRAGADLTLIVEGERILARKADLIAGSLVFKAMLEGDFKESRQLEIKIEEVDGDFFKQVILFVHTKSIDLNSSNLETFLSLAIQFQISELQIECQKYFEIALNEDNLKEGLALSKRHDKLLNTSIEKFLLEQIDKRVKKSGLLAEILFAENYSFKIYQKALYDSLALKMHGWIASNTFNTETASNVFNAAEEWWELLRSTQSPDRQQLCNALKNSFVQVVSKENFMDLFNKASKNNNLFLKDLLTFSMETHPEIALSASNGDVEILNAFQQ